MDILTSQPELHSFGKVISSIGYNEQEIIRNILLLHGNGNPIECDPTFSVGNFYKHGLPLPIHRFDKTPQVDGVVEAMSDNLPLGDKSVNVIMFAPPFVIGGQNYRDSKDGSSIISKRFTSFGSWDELKDMYHRSLVEFNRILKDDGIVIFKCQDVVAGGKNHFSHCWVMYDAISAGFYPKDMFVLLAKNRITDTRKQQHAIKYHSYYWVFKKQKSRVVYRHHDDKEK